jgi:hypothetical protein
MWHVVNCRSGRIARLHATCVATVAVAVAVPALAVGGTAPDYTPPPGALNPNVTQANISVTICARGWTRTVRPPLSYTSRLKREQMRRRHLPGTPADYQEDHFIPLELGGAPYDLRNLWPQPIEQAHRKDQWELGLNRAVCAGRMTLAAGRRKIADPHLWR